MSFELGDTVTSSTPYLSIVVTSRNDNHGDKLLCRMQKFVDCLLDQCDRHRLSAELIIVEWNPPLDRPLLVDALRWPINTGYCDIRLIQVPHEIHKRLRNSDKLPLFQMIAKNVGIRRAHGRFVLATNIDILFSEELIAYLASKALTAETMYRIDRSDVPGDLAEKPLDRLPEFCRKSVFRIHTRWGSMDARTGQYDEGSVTWKTFVHDAYMLLSGQAGEKRLHTNASGDFTLMSKTHWFRIRGYPELEMLAMHVDGLGCQIAYYAGARQRVLRNPMQIYHLDHSTSPGWKAEGDGAMTARNGNGIPQLSYDEYRQLAIRMRKKRQPIISNDQNWGFGDAKLTEIQWRNGRPVSTLSPAITPQ